MRSARFGRLAFGRATLDRTSLQYSTLLALIGFILLVSPLWAAAPDFNDTLSLIENCNVLEEPLSRGGQWSQPIISTHTGLMRADGSVCNRGTAETTGSAWWTVTTYGPDMAASMDFVDATTAAGLSMSLYVRLIQPGVVSQTDGYRCVFLPNTADISIDRLDNGVPGTIASCTALSGAMLAGHQIACEAIGTTITAYIGRSDVWTAECSVVDTTYPTAGYGGFGGNTNTLRSDNLRFGTFTASAPTLEALMPIIP